MWAEYPQIVRIKSDCGDHKTLRLDAAGQKLLSVAFLGQLSGLRPESFTIDRHVYEQLGGKILKDIDNIQG